MGSLDLRLEAYGRTVQRVASLIIQSSVMPPISDYDVYSSWDVLEKK
jgi:hypothetical protein